MSKAFEVDDFIERFQNGDALNNVESSEVSDMDDSESEASEQSDSEDVSDMDDAEVRHDVSETNDTSDMDDTSSESEVIEFNKFKKPEVPRLIFPTNSGKSISNIESYDDLSSDDSSDDLSSEEEYIIGNLPEVAYVNPLLHRPFETPHSIEAYVNRFETQVKEQILPKLEEETRNMLNSIEVGVRRTSNEIRRRFLNQLDSEDEGNDIHIEIPIIPTFHTYPFQINQIRTTDEDEELLGGDQSPEKWCFQRWMTQLESDVGEIAEATVEMCHGVRDFVGRYL